MFGIQKRYFLFGNQKPLRDIMERTRLTGTFVDLCNVKYLREKNLKKYNIVVVKKTSTLDRNNYSSVYYRVLSILLGEWGGNETTARAAIRVTER